MTNEDQERGTTRPKRSRRPGTVEAVVMRRRQVRQASVRLGCAADDLAVELALAVRAGVKRSELRRASGYSAYMLPRVIAHGESLLVARDRPAS